jgi:hypothetical protein
MPVRIQIAVYDVLTAEVIVEGHMAERTWAAYTRAKYRADKPAGCAVLSRADLPRQWDVPVGHAVHGRRVEKTA